MAGNALKITGLLELREALQKLTPDLVREASVIVQAQGEAAMREMATAYPVKTGNLKNNLRIAITVDAVSATARIRNRAKHAYIFEYGTAARRRASGASTGTMPVGRVFIPIAMQRRRIMLAALIDLVEKSGLHVSGATG